MKKHLAIAAIAFVLLGPSGRVDAATSAITVRAADDSGGPLEDAEVTFGFVVPKGREWGSATIPARGFTDKKGLFGVSDGVSPKVNIVVEKPGYYQSSAEYEFKSKSLLNRWEPWNPTVEMMLKKKRNPVPMYFQFTGPLHIQKIGAPVGYDLEKGDWVAPYGSGAQSDFLFTYYTNSRAFTDYECGFTLTFSNPMDGIQEYVFPVGDSSYFKWPFDAPTSGYVDSLKKEVSDTPKDGIRSNRKEGMNYIFRVRTKIDPGGSITEARYGRVMGEFQFDPYQTLGFSYAFNPDGTRNLEVDPAKNLFQWSSRKDELVHRLGAP